jgi:hypothetical protein
MQAEVQELPPTLLQGEVRRCRLVLRNGGASALRAIRAVVSSPEVLLPDDDRGLRGDAQNALAGGCADELDYFVFP